MQQAFHTAIHKYVVNGQERWANSSDPEIPAALTLVVAGVNSLNNFPKEADASFFGSIQTVGCRREKCTRVNPQFTFAGGCNNTSTTTGTNCFAVGPADFATIYNVQPLLSAGINGSGQTIAIVSDSDIQVSRMSLRFRSIFGLPAITGLQARILTTGFNVNPVAFEFNNSANSDEEEAILDVEWSGAIAQNATIDLVVSPSTNTTFGGDTSAQCLYHKPTIWRQSLRS